MMTGIPNVNNLYRTYHILTLLLLLLFAIYDQRHHKIRNQPLVLFFLWCLFSVPISMIADPNLLLQYEILSKLSGSIGGFLLLFLISLATDGSIGGGDIKLVSLLGILYGVCGVIMVLILSCLCALLFLFVLRLLGKASCTHIPFAPYLFAGSSLYVLYQLPLT